MGIRVLARRMASVSTFALALVSLLLPSTAFADEARDGEQASAVSVALERVGGITYSRIADERDNSVSLTTFAIGGVNINPYTTPRLGVDYITSLGVTIGGAIGVGNFAGSVDSGSTSADGSLFIYTLMPRVGYRIPLSSRFDLTPRGGLTLAGGSASAGSSDDSVGLFAIALSAEVVGALRLTRSFNLLGGLAVDPTISASSSATTSTSSGSSKTQTRDADGSFVTGQLWLGLGGYL
jgi:hypothetical protein